MNIIKSILLTVFILTNNNLYSNPIPAGQPYLRMLDEEINIVINDNYQATISGTFNIRFTFTGTLPCTAKTDSFIVRFCNPPPWDFSVLFPLPESSQAISISYDNNQIAYGHSDSIYHTTVDSSLKSTIIPDILDTMPMINFDILYDCNVPDSGILNLDTTFSFKINYTHNIVKFDSTYILLYALGTRRYRYPGFIDGDMAVSPSFINSKITVQYPSFLSLNEYFPDSSYAWLDSIDTTTATIGESKVFFWNGYQINNIKDFIVAFTADENRINKPAISCSKNNPYSLICNYPNIFFTLPYKSQVSLKLYDTKGNILFESSLKSSNKGANVVRIDNKAINDMASGIYMIKLSINNQEYIYKTSFIK
jgi:hypothetical protein